MPQRVEKNAKVNIHQEQVRDTLETSFMCVLYVDVPHYTSMRVPCAFGLKNFLCMLRNFLEAQRVLVCVLYTMNKFNTRYRCIEYTLNMFSAC